MAKTLSGIHQGKPNSGAPSQKEEMYGSEEQIERSVAPALTAAQEAELWRRIDLRLMPMITLMCLLSSMDKSNIGSAKLDGLIAQLNLAGNKYNIALMIYFIPPILLEFSSNLVIHVIRPSKWLPGIMILSGLVMMLMGFVTTYPQLVGVRVCLGVAEAGLYPGVVYYITVWYPKYMCQYQLALLWGAGSLAGVFSGLLAYAIGFMDGDDGLEAWSWVFVFEGVATMLIGSIAVFVTVDYPATAKFLTAEERSFVIEKKGRDDAEDEEQHVSQQVWAAFTDWQVWALSVVQISFAVPLYGITYFLPTITYGFGYSTSISQLLTIPPYALSTVTVLVFAYLSDQTKLRSPFIFAAQLIALLGYIINISEVPPGLKYFGTYLCVIGSYAGVPGATSWLANNLRGKYKRSIGMALQISVGNLGGVIGSNIFRIQAGPGYLLGYGMEIVFISVGLVVVPVTVLAYTYMNAQIDHEELLEKQRGHNAESKQKGGTSSIGFQASGFRYTL
ncbi:MFS general substrate transporter [Paxillus ammoniavirescens]|nr:MFS general substrate transporter [Paxillus ammoniavirescens]